MLLVSFLYPALLAASGADALRSDKVKLSNIQSLTLRKGLQTSARRVDPIPQLKCVGGSARGLYEPEVMRCKNSGSDYDENSIQWTCTASLPEEFKLGSTDVICEGYDYPEDPYILKGSCGVEYRLILTDRGREKYGKGGGWSGDDDDRPDGPRTTGEKIAGVLFWMLFGGVVLWMIYSALKNRAQGPDGVPGVNRPGWGGGGGGGWGGGYNDDNDDPPPPYYPNRPNNPNNPKSGYGTNQGWRPGFWSGAAGGAAAGWAAGQFANRGNRSNQTGGWRDGNGSGSRWNNGGEGNSRSSSGDSFSSTRHESTGFGGTSRR
ncbi:Transmembrane protein [Pyrenophora teres f. maculata]|nr:Transmembrane protein [Pyrenophora teres f. maculata]